MLKLVLVAALSQASMPVDAPLLIPKDQPAVLRIEGGVVSVFRPDGTPAVVQVSEGFYVNEAFAENVENKVQALGQHLAAITAERDSYKEQAIEEAAKPGLSWPLIIGVAVGSIALGAGAVIGINALAK